jgi:ABC-type nickel/cobalt efflux system permease component RcnA
VNAVPAVLLLGGVAAVGVLHTIVPDHWLPIALIARQRRWSRRETAAAALRAGTGHVLSTLVLGLAVWFAGTAIADRFGHVVDLVASAALVGFGGWTAASALAELRAAGALRHPHGHGHDRLHHHPHVPSDDPFYLPLPGGAAVLTRHMHQHRHGRNWVHIHWHEHASATDHAVVAGLPPVHAHRHKTSGRTALVLILGSSPMVEGIPLFFAAAGEGRALLGGMAAVFAASAIATYVLLCVSAAAGLERLRFGAVERYGEVLSGALIAVIGVLFWFRPLM